jgi:uncharacterized protein YjbJ (UPF0337 family)
MKDEIKGKVEEIKGRVTGDRSEEMRGKAHQAEDKVRRTVRDIKEDVKEGVDNEKEKEREREAETVRERRSW